jgi:23S rRNA pseudouridine2605 synthase
VQKSPGVAAARRGGADKKRGGGAPREPDPMRTSVGYIGGDAFLRAGNRGGGRRGKR